MIKTSTTAAPPQQPPTAPPASLRSLSEIVPLFGEPARATSSSSLAMGGVADPSDSITSSDDTALLLEFEPARYSATFRLLEELVATEKTYFQYLDVLVNHYYKPLSDSHILDTCAIQRVFGNIEEIYTMTIDLFQALDQEWLHYQTDFKTAVAASASATSSSQQHARRAPAEFDKLPPASPMWTTSSMPRKLSPERPAVVGPPPTYPPPPPPTAVNESARSTSDLISPRSRSTLAITVFPTSDPSTVESEQPDSMLDDDDDDDDNDNIDNNNDDAGEDEEDEVDRMELPITRYQCSPLQNVGIILSTAVPFIRHQYSAYCRRYLGAVEELQYQRQNNTGFSEFINWCRDICGGLDLEWLLRIPLLRPAQYRVIFTELLESASVSSAIATHVPKSRTSLSLSRCGVLEEVALQTALNGITEVCEVIDMAIAAQAPNAASSDVFERVVSDLEGLNVVVVGDASDERPKCSLIAAVLKKELENCRHAWSSTTTLGGGSSSASSSWSPPVPQCGWPIMSLFLPSEYSPTGERECFMRIWDSTGVEKYDNLRQLIYIHADVFILAFSIQRPDQYKRLVHKWIRELSKVSTTTPIILVGLDAEVRNVSSDGGSVVVSTTEAQSLANNLGIPYIECSWRTGSNVLEVFREAASAVLHKARYADMRHTLFDRANTASVRILQALHKQSLSLEKLMLTTELVPDEIKYCYQLRELNLSANKLSTIPHQLKHLTRLQRLYLEYNDLESLTGIEKLTNLRELHLTRNRLTYLPPSIGYFTNLQTLRLDSNPLDTIPKDIIPRKTMTSPTEMQQLLAYLRGIGSGGKETHNQVKVMFVGDGNVGKTSLLNCFMAHSMTRRKASITLSQFSRNKNKDPTDTKATDGIAISQVLFSPEVGDASSGGGGGGGGGGGEQQPQSSVMMWDCWDYAGQDVYYTTHQFFLSHGAIYIICFNLLQRDLSKIEYWLNSVHTRARGSPILLVGTHLDDKRCTNEYVQNFIQDIKRRYMKRFRDNLGVPSIQEVIAVSCKGKRIGIKTVMDRVAQIARKFRLVGQLFPASWLRLESQLRAMSSRKPFMKWDEFVNASQSCSIDDADIVEAVKFLHNSGAVCHFSALNTSMSDIVILDPQFLTNVMAAVVTLKHSFGKRDGRLTQQEIPHVWIEFPTEIHATLMELLVRFEVVFRLPDKASERDRSDTLMLNSLDSLNSSVDSLTLSAPSIETGRVRDSVGPLERLGGISASAIGDEHATLTSTSTTSLSSSNINNYMGTYLVPSLLPDQQPPMVERVWPVTFDPQRMNQVSRIYTFKFLPLGFFSRLFVRNLHLPGVELVDDCYWLNGCVLVHRGETALLRYNPSSYKLTIHVRVPTSTSNEAAAVDQAGQLLRLLVENVETVIEGWYETEVSVEVPCTHCVAAGSYDPFLFPVEELVDAVRSGTGFVRCRGTRKIRIDVLAPDVAFADMSSRLVPFNKITIVRELGRGAFGLVYEATYKRQPIALKLLEESTSSAGGTEALSEETSGLGGNASDASGYRKFLEFQREAWIMSQIRHEKLVELVGLCNKPLGMMMELIPLGDLYHVLYNGEVERYRETSAALHGSWHARLRVALDVAQGMRYLHSLSPPIIHRDLRSPNIFLHSTSLEAPTLAKVGDFGLSRLMGPVLAGGEFNQNWLAPEVMKMEQYTEKIDVYSYGIILYELVSLVKPFAEYDHLFAGKPRNAFREAVIGGLRPSIPIDAAPEFAQLIQDCWQSAPERRPGFGDIVRRLVVYMRSLDMPASEDVEDELLEDLASIPIHDSSDASDEPRRPSLDSSSESGFGASRRISSSGGGHRRQPSTAGEAYAPPQVKLLGTLSPSHPHTIQSLLLVEDLVWAGCRNGLVRMWNIATQEHRDFQAHEKCLYKLALVDEYVWACCGQGDITLWHAQTRWSGKLTKPIKLPPAHKEDVRAILVVKADDASRSVVWTGDPSGLINVWSVKKKGKVSSKIKKIRINRPVESIYQYRDTIWVGTDGVIFVFNAKTHECIRMWAAHNGLINDMVCCGAYMWSCGQDYTICIWDPNDPLSEEPVKRIKGHTSKVFCLLTVDHYVWSGSFDTSIIIWSGATFDFVQELKGAHTDGVRSLLRVAPESVWSGAMQSDGRIAQWIVPRPPRPPTVALNHSPRTVARAMASLHLAQKGVVEV